LFPSKSLINLVRGLKQFLEPYMKAFCRREQRENATAYLNGRFRNMPRRTIEPVANATGRNPEALQKFIGAGKWSDTPLREELHRDVAKTIGSPDGVMILDGSGFPKKGTESVGVQRQWCGRLGKEDNCQVGQFVAYAAGGAYALLDGELYLPKSWLTEEQREKGRVPDEKEFKTGWAIADDLQKRNAKRLPHAWVVGDEDYGVPNELRDGLHARRERYALEVKPNTRFWLADASGNTRGKPINVKDFRASLPKKAWRSFHVRDGEKEPRIHEATRVWVVTPRDGKMGTRVESLVLVRSPEKDWQYLSNAPSETPLGEVVRATACRHAVEELLELAKGDVGLDEYEVRSYVGWHHHLTFSLLALWFLLKQKTELEKKLPRSPFPSFDGPSLFRWTVKPLNTSSRKSLASSGETRRRGGRTGKPVVIDHPLGGARRSLGRDDVSIVTALELAAEFAESAELPQ
jgi:SRSO17 transposase